MNCCQCQGIETLFNEKFAAKELERYRKKGPSTTTRMLIDALKAEGIEGMTLLDIGGGVGAIQHALLEAGASSAINVEASTGYLRVAEEEATRRGLAHRVTYHHGDFVDLAPMIPPADIVTLDRVICCYHDMEALVDLSSARARRLYGLVYPRDTWWMRWLVKLVGPLVLLYLRIRRNPYRFFLHPTAEVDAIVRRNGLVPCFYRTHRVWQVWVYKRV